MYFKTNLHNIEVVRDIVLLLMSMLLAATPTFGASSPNNIKDNATGMPARCRRTCTCHSHIGRRRRSNSLVLCAGSSAHDAVLAPLVGGGACTTFPFKSRGGGGHAGWLCVGCVLVIFVLCSAKSHKQAKVRLMVNIWHIGYCRKALVIARTISRLYGAVNVGIKEKRRKGSPHCT